MASLSGNTFIAPSATVAILLIFYYGRSVDSASSIQHQKSGWGSPFSKPGECPASNQSTSCDKTPNPCKSDCECPLKQKCCWQENCGYLCKEPTVIIETVSTCEEKIAPSQKPGTCPPPLLTVRCARCVDQCISDCECEGQMKCCPQPGCGNWCRNSTETDASRQIQNENLYIEENYTITENMKIFPDEDHSEKIPVFKEIPHILCIGLTVSGVLETCFPPGCKCANGAGICNIKNKCIRT